LIAEMLLPMGKGAFQNEKLETGGRPERDVSARPPTLECHHLVLITEQRCDFHARPSWVSTIIELASLEMKWRAIGRVELPKLYENGTALVGTRCMRRGRWIADIRARGIVTMLVLEYALENKEFFTAAMYMTREMRLGGIPDNRCRTRNLPTNAIEHAAFDTRDRGGDPVELPCVNHSALCEVCVKFHMYPYMGEMLGRLLWGKPL